MNYMTTKEAATLDAVSNKIARKWNRGVSLLEPSEDD